ncbi:UNVERIFIED_CONTAM: hypothetical protein PYX00_003874 [Menopon gallinae]|uniref:Uncharacterized protein n=1 Tax=Menopon gallinae TaxID=328185 RepID=A0AAW2I267_9NEOP
MADASAKQEITVKRISAFKFEIEVSDGVSNTEETSVETSEVVSNSDKSCKMGVGSEGQNRISVIRRAPPAASYARGAQGRPRTPEEKMYICRKRVGEGGTAPPGAILIKDAILYRIIEILLWKLLGEENLSYWGYPTTPTYRLLWKIVYHFSCFQPGAVATLQQDHDCQGDINCFMDHVEHFLQLCAPTRELKEKFKWYSLSREEILKKIYCEDLLPFLRKSDLSNHANILNSHNDILRLQRWQDQGFTAISWNGHEHFSRLKSRFPWCPQCCKRLRKSVISYKFT